MIKKCVTCGNEFSNKIHNALNCSAECKKLYAKLKRSEWKKNNVDRQYMYCNNWHKKNIKKMNLVAKKWRESNYSKFKEIQNLYYLFNTSKVDSKCKKIAAIKTAFKRNILTHKLLTLIKDGKTYEAYN